MSTASKPAPPPKAAAALSAHFSQASGLTFLELLDLLLREANTVYLDERNHSLKDELTKQDSTQLFTIPLCKGACFGMAALNHHLCLVVNIKHLK